MLVKNIGFLLPLGLVAAHYLYRSVHDDLFITLNGKKLYFVSESWGNFLQTIEHEFCVPQIIIIVS